MSMMLVCLGDINVTVNPPACSVGWSAINTGLGFDITQLDPSAIFGAFTAGATICFVPLSIAWAAGFILKSLR